jgi:hypothetical protein
MLLVDLEILQSDGIVRRRIEDSLDGVTSERGKPRRGTDLGDGGGLGGYDIPDAGNVAGVDRSSREPVLIFWG